VSSRDVAARLSSRRRAGIGLWRRSYSGMASAAWLDEVLMRVAVRNRTAQQRKVS
jgi:hypothetical protein